MPKELEKAYEPKKFEDGIYKRWEDSGFFNPDNLSGEPYSIMMPPPNVTGVLHLGHALENALMDTMARYQRMQGKKVLLVPGTDHAALPTQAKVEKLLIKDGMKNPRQELGREKLVEKIREFAEQSKSTILGQVKKMGTSCDWSRLAYTFDETRNVAVNELFLRMYNDGLIYRGYRVVNWSVKGQSTCSDDEVIHMERPSKLYTFKYAVDFPISIATTRPETKLGDTAVAVNPKDSRYQEYLGKIYTVDVGAAKPLNIKIIADENVDPNFGTGALGVTPAHSAVDFEMYVKQKAKADPIEIIPVIGVDGKMTEDSGTEYVGLSVEEAREKFVQYLRDHNLLEKEEDIVQNIGTSDRFGDIVEALPMTQWWLDMNKVIPAKNKTLKDLMREAVTTGLHGDAKQLVTITPDRFNKMYLDRIDNLRDWCLSRQIWWGHRIPVWYKRVGENEEIFVGAKAPAGDGWVQDEDTLDTWFSSGSWTFSTLGWPEQTEDLKTFHSTSWIQMGYEIIYLWMMRMILMSTYALDQIPFKDVYIHGILRDENGKKFSKSSGNGIDPLEIIEQYGCDALRLSVLSGISPGNDSRFFTEKVEGARNLVNKVWNISRFMLLSISEPKKDIALPQAKTLSDQWILSRLQSVITEVKGDFDSFQFSAASERLRDFTWGDLADWYLEIAKIEGNPSADSGQDKSEILNYLFNTLLKLWHPFMPYVTEAVWESVYGESAMLMVEKFPVVSKINTDEKTMNNFVILQNIITKIRAVRTEYKIEPSKKIKAVFVTEDLKSIEENKAIFLRLANLEDLQLNVQKPEGAISFVESGVEVYLDFSSAVDVEKEKTRLEKEIAAVAPYVQSLTEKLAGDFSSSAPTPIVEKEKAKLAEAKEKLEKLQQQLSSLKK